MNLLNTNISFLKKRIMKKKLLIAALLVATMSASSQSRFDAGTFSIQPYLGGTGAMLSNMPAINEGLSKDIDATATGGAIIGAEAEFRFTNRFSFAAGVNWAQAGSGWKDADIISKGVKLEMRDTKIETSYVNVPLTLNYYIFKGFAIKAGAQFGFLTSAKVKYNLREKSGSSTMKLEFDEDIKDGFEKFDFSIPVGISYEFKVPVTIDMRYNIGLTKVNKDSTPDGKDCRNQVLSITVGYKFGL